MAGVGSKLEELLKCTICHDLVRNPKTLRCFHSFCEACLEQIQRVSHAGTLGIHCPVCRAFSKEGTAKMNFLVHELLETHTSCKAGLQNQCEMCLKQKSEWKCVECKVFLCGSCKVLHFRLPVCRGHHMVKTDSQEAELTIDRTVFCGKHTDQPIIFNCRECEVPMCMKCKVTKHETHRTETVEDTLERVLPEIGIYAEKVVLLMANIEENREELNIRTDELKAAFQKCRETGKKRLQDIIDAATEDYNALMKDLDIREDEELDKLRLHQQKEYAHLVDWMKTCSEAARGVTLMEQVQSGLCKRMKEVAGMKTIEKSTTRLCFPCLIVNEGKVVSTGENVIGKIEYRTAKILNKQTQGHSKNPEKSFSEILSKEFKIETEVPVKERCTRISVICGNIWAAVPSSNCIKVVSMAGTIHQEIRCTFQPYSAKESPWGDIIVAGSDGLFIMQPDGTLETTVSTDSFRDVSFLGEEIIGLNDTKQVLQSFLKTADGKWSCNGEITSSQGTGSDSGDCVIIKEQNIIFTMKSSKSSQLFRCQGKNGSIATLASNQRTMSYPYPCGVDGTGAILVADVNNKIFQLCDAENKWQVMNIPCISSYNPFDLLYDADTDTVWVLLRYKGLVKLA